MDRAMLQDHLALAERHIRQGQDALMRQSELIRTLQKQGHDTAESKRLLAEFEKLQALHIDDRDRLRALLAGPPA